MSDQPNKRVLNGRYEVDAVLGQGGMAKVFRGRDNVLGRTVAVKVLSPQFAADDQFVTRFRREAQAAAGLNHRNIVSIFDTGSTQDVHYIVMEYVEGRTLRDVIREEGSLLPERSVEIAAAVADALGAAHEAGLVHRDVKPGNIMLTRQGEVKVMDFGIARTTTGDTLTQTAAVLGTASYLSPEQAQGVTVDARSDIYSLGCVLYEMLVGAPPFTGDSPVAVAYRHVREDPVPPSRRNGDVSPDLEAVVMKSLAKNPANRYQTAQELREDLERVRQGLPAMATPLLAGTTEAMTRPVEGTAVMEGTGVLEEAPPEERERSRWPMILGLLLLLALLGLGAFFLIRALLPEPPQLVTVPNVIGLQEEQAVNRLELADLEVNVEREFSDDVARGEVFDQDPGEGDEVEPGTEVTIVVSRGAEPVEVPDVTGGTVEDAEAQLADAGLALGDVIEQASDDVDQGIVFAQDPAPGERLRPGGSVDVTVSTGPAMVAVPDVVCDSIADARQQITDAGLVPQNVGSEFSEECPRGTVASQDPEANTQVERGSVVEYTRSQGEEPDENGPNGPPTPTVTP